ncbi:Tudor domain-containing protein 7B [Merluccius polli]|uniref:Tudor domain-containing protein 7B n=1 Tax=Merluccius polli TaxID=89951 RepID=A0AA47MFW6_MERPO|nr:Tudor domain-containing protein 7B [Merluccius polli]
MRCFAAVCKETRHIAELVARQKTSKKCGRSQLVNSRMRSKPSNPYMLNVKPRARLRQPSLDSSGWLSARPRPYSGYGGFSASGDYRTGAPAQLSPCNTEELPPSQPTDLRPSQPTDPRPSQPTDPRPRQPTDPRPNQPTNLHPRLSPSLPPVHHPRLKGTESRPLAPRRQHLLNVSLPPNLEVYNPELVQSRLSDLLAKHCSGLWLSKLPGVYLDMFSQTIPPQALHQLDTWTHICAVENLNSTNRTNRLVYPPLPPKPMASVTPSTLPSSKPSSPSTLPSPKPASPSTLPSPKPASPFILPSPKQAFPSTLPSPKPIFPSTKPASPSTLPSPKPPSPSTFPSPTPASLSPLPSPKPFSLSFTSFPSSKPSSPLTSPRLPSPKSASPSNIFTMSKQPSPLAPPTFLFPPPSPESSPFKTPTSVTLRSPSWTPGSAPYTFSALSNAPGSAHTSPAGPTMRSGFLPNGGLVTPAAPPTSWSTHHSCPGNQSPTPCESSPPCQANATPLRSSPTPLPAAIPFHSPLLSTPTSTTPTSNPSTPPPPTSNPSTPPPVAPTPSTEVLARLQELLSKYSHGVWINALPRLFLDTYKTAFPEAILAQLSLLHHICSVEYPIPHDRSKAILYEPSKAEAQRGASCSTPASGVRVLSVQPTPPLALPTEQYPSVLVTETRGSNHVTIRYVGESYSTAQESMENAMVAFYAQSPAPKTLPSPAIGQLAAVTGEDGDELARVQVVGFTTSDKVKVYYVDYGFSMEVSSSSLLELHHDFLALPFQAITVQLAGLEAWKFEPRVLAALDRLAVGRILLMETVTACHQGQMAPLVVLYDTSQDEDLNINAACLKALRDPQDHAPLAVNSRYQDVCVTNVSSDGTLSCQLPCRGSSSLSSLLAKIEAFFSSQVTSESLVSQPFSGKLCLARHKGKWSRAEISNLHGSRVMDIEFFDLGVNASVEVTELREVPPPFLNDLTVIPPQAVRCVLADLGGASGPWSPAALLWIRQTVLNTPCSMKVKEVQQSSKGPVVQVSLFSGSEDQEEKSINQQLVWSGLLSPEQNNNNTSLPDTGDLSSLVEKWSLNGPSVGPMLPQAQTEPAPVKLPTVGQKPLVKPPLVELPQVGQNMDVFVPVASHPGHFVVQPWQDLYKLVVLMGEMVLYYNQSQTSSTPPLLHKDQIYAAKVDNNWHRVLVKGVLSTGLVSVFELDYGRYELVSSSQLRPLIAEFRQLPFQAVTAQLAGVPHAGWSEEASMVFRSHVEKRALVAQVESVSEAPEVEAGGAVVGGRRLTVFLVDTSVEDNDVWIHNIMTDLLDKFPAAT